MNEAIIKTKNASNLMRFLKLIYYAHDLGRTFGSKFEVQAHAPVAAV